ncbi:MAG: alpha/beta hydrolase, partial [Leptospira sp.]|nr:alpha/beta hydrolase [Leptospira sp.]
LSGNSDPSRFNDPSQIIDPSRYPENFYDSIQLQKVIFLNGGLFPETHRARLVQKIMASSFAPLVMPFFKRKQFGKSFSAVFGENTQPSPEELDALWEIIQYDNGHKMIHRLLSYIQQRRENRERWVDSIVNPPVPIRLINGNADPVSGIHMVQRYVELTGREDTVNLTKIGHYPQLEDVEAVGKAVMDFFI